MNTLLEIAIKPYYTYYHNPLSDRKYSNKKN